MGEIEQRTRTRLQYGKPLLNFIGSAIYDLGNVCSKENGSTCELRAVDVTIRKPLYNALIQGIVQMFRFCFTDNIYLIPAFR